ncbi:hypothetical protein P154DRAFT_517337 [Amniculicola lignicola CBS 123094]|uniref:Uncharacterized protein n=1 Tax=Amniculicola lignicola CBS 123094 TaxID=1392246 RepID=A0A6A5X2B2_9PLEO|nr:hypothetical protein P154DRAFT_517337 [Amniculicola lignicola CBS 123094]
MVPNIVEIWLRVFQALQDPNVLWSTVRHVSRFLCACVEEHFRHGIIQNTFIDLHYSDFHTRHGPDNGYIHIPLVFDRFSQDGSLAVFQQRVFKRNNSSPVAGSVRGWVPFIERYHLEVRKPKPQILNKSQANNGPPLWEAEHGDIRNSLSGDEKKNYLISMGKMVSIARGDRPPYYIKIFNAINDTELVDPVIDCREREVSFDWRKTYTMFFREEEFVIRASRLPRSKKRCYDKDLPAVAARWGYDKSYQDDDGLRARQKRLQKWTNKNKHRLSSEMRLWTEVRVNLEKVLLLRILRHDNLGPVIEEQEEIVPEKLADDHPDLLFWPWGDADRFFVPARRVPRNCVVM